MYAISRIYIYRHTVREKTKTLTSLISLNENCRLGTDYIVNSKNQIKEQNQEHQTLTKVDESKNTALNLPKGL